jgi:uncharacterized membrane protein
VSRRRGAGGRNALGIVLIALALVVLGGLAGAALWLRPPPTDAANCCTDALLAAHGVLVDPPIA